MSTTRFYDNEPRPSTWLTRLFSYMLVCGLMLNPLVSSAQQLLEYSIRFRPGVESLPSLALVDSLKMVAAAALPIDTQTIIIRRYIDYWMQDEQYYVLTRKRSFLLQQIFQRAGINARRLVLETQPIEDPALATTERDRIDVLLTPHYVPSALTDTVKTEEAAEPNFYSEIRELLWKLNDNRQQGFLIDPRRDTILCTEGGACLFIAANSFNIPNTIDSVVLTLREAFSKSELLPYQLATLEEDSIAKLRAWGGLLHLIATAKGRELELKADKEILLFLPTDEISTHLRLYYSKSSPQQALRWRALEMGFWEPETALCLHLPEADKNDGTYFCHRLNLERPAVPIFPEKPEEPVFLQMPKERLVQLDSSIKVYDEVINNIKTEYEAKTGKRWTPKRKKEQQEQQYQRELENTLREKRKAENLKKKELEVFNAKNAAIKAVYDSIFYLYNHRRDSLQQAYLYAVRDWQLAKDSIQWLCNYEQYQVPFLEQRYGKARVEQFKAALQAAPNPDLNSPMAKLLFGIGKAHFVVPTRRLGWLSLQQQQSGGENPLHYTVFTDRELPTYKLATMALLRKCRAAVSGKAGDAENINFNPLPAEDKIWVLALYIEDGKYMLALQPATANRLPMKPEFKRFDTVEELRAELKKVMDK